MAGVLCILANVVLALTALRCCGAAAPNPGFRTIVTQKGLDYVNQVGVPILKEELQSLTIPDISGTATVKAIASITIDYAVSNIILKSLDFGDHSLTSGADGLTADVTEVSLALSADWSYEEHGWPHLKDHGAVDISASEIDLSVSVNVTANKTDGHLQLNTTACSFSIGSISVVFHGGASWLYNLFQSTIEDLLRQELTKQVCTLAINETNTMGNKEAESLNVTVPIDDKIEISYALVSDPTFKPSCIVTDHKGEFLLRADPQMNPPFLPPTLPPVEHFNSSKMFYAILTTYVADSASYAYWKAGYMAYSMKLPGFMKKTTELCALLKIPQLCEKFPNMDVTLSVNATKYPTLNVTRNYAVVSAEGLGSLFVTNGTHMELAFSLDLRVQADATAFVRSNKTHIFICGNVSNPRVNISIAKSNIGPFNVSNLDVYIPLLNQFGLSYLNGYVNTGFPLPMVDGIYLTNTSIAFGKGYILVGSDVKYNPDHLQKLSSNIPKSKLTPPTPPHHPPSHPPSFSLPHNLKGYHPPVEI